jgi:hypothetical protein
MYIINWSFFSKNIMCLGFMSDAISVIFLVVCSRTLKESHTLWEIMLNMSLTNYCTKKKILISLNIPNFIFSLSITSLQTLFPLNFQFSKFVNFFKELKMMKYCIFKENKIIFNSYYNMHARTEPWKWLLRKKEKKEQHWKW